MVIKPTIQAKLNYLDLLLLLAVTHPLFLFSFHSFTIIISITNKVKFFIATPIALFSTITNNT